MSRSLRVRMTASLLVVLILALGMLSIVVHQVVSRALVKQLDAQLADDASAVAGMAEDEGAAVEFEYESLPDFERPQRPAYFQAWLDDGQVLGRSPSLQGRALPRPSPNGGALTYAWLRSILRLRRSLQKNALRDDQVVRFVEVAEQLKEMAARPA